MNTKIIIAVTVAALSLATTAFAQSEGGSAQAFPVPTSTFSSSAQQRNNGWQQYQAYDAGQTHAVFDNTVLPSLGQNGAVQTANSLPKGFEDGTPQFMEAQSINRWFAQQADHRFAQLHGLVNGRRG